MKKSKKGTGRYMILIGVLSIVISIILFNIFKSYDLVIIMLLILLILLGASIRYNQ